MECTPRHATRHGPDAPPSATTWWSRGRPAATAAALEELFRRYREPAYRVAYRLLGNPEDALDAVQDGFIKALTHLDGFEQRCSFKTWLLRVVSNAALDLGRQRRRRDELSAAVTELFGRRGRDARPRRPRPRSRRERPARALADALRQLARSPAPDVRACTWTAG